MDLPIFPLHLVLFPGRPLPLHLFEPRYITMLQDCMDGDGRFGVVAIRAGREVGTQWSTESEDGTLSESGAAEDHDVSPMRSTIHEVGTFSQLDTVAERADGRYDIIAKGCGRFRVLQPLNDRSYLRARVEALPEDVEDPRDATIAGNLREVLIPYLHRLGVPQEYTERLPSDPRELSYTACSALQVEVPIQQRLLELPTPADRMLAAAKIIRRESGIIKHLGRVGSFRPVGPGGAQLN